MIAWDETGLSVSHPVYLARYLCVRLNKYYSVDRDSRKRSALPARTHSFERCFGRSDFRRRFELCRAGPWVSEVLRSALNGESSRVRLICTRWFS